MLPKRKKIMEMTLLTLIGKGSIIGYRTLKIELVASFPNRAKIVRLGMEVTLLTRVSKFAQICVQAPCGTPLKYKKCHGK